MYVYCINLPFSVKQVVTMYVYCIYPAMSIVKSHDFVKLMVKTKTQKACHSNPV